MKCNNSMVSFDKGLSLVLATGSFPSCNFQTVTRAWLSAGEGQLFARFS